MLNIGYRRTEQQLNDIVHATNISALQDMLADAAAQGLAELVVQFSSTDGTAADVERLIRSVETDVGGQGWTVTFYPNRDNVGLVEILLAG